MRSRAGSVGVGDAARTSSTRAGRRADEQRARLPDEPDAERAALQHEAGPRVQLARLVADEVAEQPERGALGARPARGCGFGRTTFAPRLA